MSVVVFFNLHFLIALEIGKIKHLILLLKTFLCLNPMGTHLSWSGIFTHKSVVEDSKLWGIVVNIQDSHKNSHTGHLFGIV